MAREALVDVYRGTTADIRRPKFYWVGRSLDCPIAVVSQGQHNLGRGKGQYFYHVSEGVRKDCTEVLKLQKRSGTSEGNIPEGQAGKKSTDLSPYDRIYRLDRLTHKARIVSCNGIATGSNKALRKKENKEWQPMQITGLLITTNEKWLTQSSETTQPGLQLQKHPARLYDKDIDGLLISEFDYSYPSWSYGVSRSDIDFNQRIANRSDAGTINRSEGVRWKQRHVKWRSQ